MAVRDGRGGDGGDELVRLAEELWQTYRGHVFQYYKRLGLSDDEAAAYTLENAFADWDPRERLDAN